MRIANINALRRAHPTRVPRSRDISSHYRPRPGSQEPAADRSVLFCKHATEGPGQARSSKNMQVWSVPMAGGSPGR